MKKWYCLLIIMSVALGAQELIAQGQVGIRRVGTNAGMRTTAEIMATSRQRSVCAEEIVTRGGSKKHDEIGLNFLGARVEQALYSVPQSGSFPPDTMGAIGPTQFIVAINGRIRSFDKKTGQPDFILDATTNDFFILQLNGRGTTDPRIRYDRFSERWFIIMITGSDIESGENGNNRILFAVSSTKDISFSTEWFFSFFEVGDEFFLDQPTLGIDNQALYIGGLLFFANTGFVPINQPLYVVNKEELVEVNDLIVTEFTYLTSPASSLPDSLNIQGVDNFDKDATVGHFIGIDDFSTNHLVLFRVFDPGSESPTLSDPILIQVPEICSPLSVPQRGVNRNLDAPGNGVRLFMAQIRDGHLWTTHHVGVNNKGKCSTTKPPTRDGARWYEINVKHEQPSLRQYGTLFDKTKKNKTNARYYFYPSLMVSGQGDMALGCSTAGENRFVNCAIARRFKHDPKGTLQKPIKYTDSDTTYNPANGPRELLRWGDYSYTSVDPCDDMTIWTIQEYVVDTDQWGVQVAQLRAPGPAKPVEVNPCIVAEGRSSEKLIICGRSHDGSGFFDPGKGFDCRLQVKISGGVKVKKVKYIDSTTIKIKVSTKYACPGFKKITIINPDGQKIVAHDLLKVVSCENVTCCAC